MTRPDGINGHPITTLKELLDLLDKPRWDLLMIGDGAGQGWDKPAGWGVVSIDRQSGARNLFVGGVSRGTVNYAELACYLHALRYDFSKTNNHRLLYKRHVVIVSDSEVTVRTGNGEYSPATNNPSTWHELEFFRGQGYDVRFFYQPRGTNLMNLAMDQVSKQGDVLSVGLDWLDVYSVMPYDHTHLPPDTTPPLMPMSVLQDIERDRLRQDHEAHTAVPAEPGPEAQA